MTFPAIGSRTHVAKRVGANDNRRPNEQKRTRRRAMSHELTLFYRTTQM